MAGRSIRLATWRKQSTRTALLRVNRALLRVSTLPRVRIAMGAGGSAQSVAGVRKQNCSGANMTERNPFLRAERADLLLMETLKSEL